MRGAAGEHFAPVPAVEAAEGGASANSVELLFMNNNDMPIADAARRCGRADDLRALLRVHDRERLGHADLGAVRHADGQDQASVDREPGVR